MARAARQLTGLPPNVLAWLPGGQSMTSLRAIMAPNGIPLAMPLARQTMSGSTPQCSTAYIAGSAHAALHLVGHQQNAVPPAHLAQAGRKSSGGT